MLKSTTQLLLLWILVTIHSANDAFAQDDCQLKKDKDGIKVYSCHSEESEFREVRATFTINCTIEEYLKVVRDVENYKSWQYKSSNGKILESISPFELIYYAEIGAPWPVSNRDVVIRLQLIPDSANQSLTILLSGMPDYIPEKEGLVRVPYSNSTMVLTPMGDSKLYGDYRILVDPGGHLPAWVVNLVSAEAPYETFINLKEILEN